MAPGCEHFCSNDRPLVMVLKISQDQPAGERLIIMPFDDVRLISYLASEFRTEFAAHPPPGLPLSIRFARLT